MPACKPAADVNLLLGILAVQMEFVTRDQLIAGMHAWVLDKKKDLGSILVAQSALSVTRHSLLQTLVQEHLKQHQNDPQQSLASLNVSPGFKKDFAQIADADVQASLAFAPSFEVGDPYATLASTGELPAAPGMRFRILRSHAKGGLGEVFVAHDEELHREVALKEIQDRHADNPESRARFLLEAEVTGALEHPGIVPVYGMGQYADGRPYYAMRFIKGDSLKDAIERLHKGPANAESGERALELRDLLTRLVAVCQTMQYAHDRGVLHRDLKPANIMLGKYGETLIVDWGLAKVGKAGDPGATTTADEPKLAPSGSGSDETLPGAAIGTPSFMSPEQAAGRLDQLGPASDVYSLGATLYSILTGKAPVEDKDVGAVLRKVQRGEFARPRQLKPGVDPALEAICVKAMALKPGERYASARALAEDLERWLAGTPVSAWPEPWTVRTRRWISKHRTLVVTSTAVTLVTLLGASIALYLRQEMVAQERTHVAVLVIGLLDCDIDKVNERIADLDSHRQWADPILQAAHDEAAKDGNTPRRLRASLALLAKDPSHVEFLYSRLLDAEAQEIAPIRSALYPHKGELTERLWATMDQPDKGTQRLRAASALALYAPADARWHKAAPLVVEQLVAVNPIVLERWLKALAPVKGKLLEPLGVVFRDRRPGRAGERRLATTILLDYAADQPQVLAQLLLDADEKQFRAVFPKAFAHAEHARKLLEDEVKTTPPPHARNEEREKLAKRQANAAVALLRMNRAAPAWPLLEHGPDPRTRSYLIHRLGPLGVDASLVVKRLPQEPVTIQRALVLSLGAFSANDLKPEQRAVTTAKLQEIYGTADDAGLHAAAEWLLRQWSQDAWLADVNKDWAAAKEQRKLRLQAIKANLAAAKQKAAPTWYVNDQGQTMVVIPEQADFWMGSPDLEDKRANDEALRQAPIVRPFAIAAQPVTIEEYLRCPRIEERTQQPADKPRLPATYVTWYQAAAYCNWLSDKDDIPESQWCYLPNDEGKYAQGMKMAPGYLQRSGYRLPTEAEMECAIRAKTKTCRFFGESAELLEHYAWFLQNSGESTQPVGLKKPNDFGLFDMHGNVWCWCQEKYAKLPHRDNGKCFQYEEKDLSVNEDARVIRGGSYYHAASIVRAAHRNAEPPSLPYKTMGFRVARTISAP